MKFSHSQIQLYKKCPRRYAYKYIDQIDAPDEASLHLLLGSTVHASLEFLYNHINDGKTSTLEDLLTSFQTERDEAYAEFEERFGKGRFSHDDLSGFYERGISYLEWYFSTYTPFQDHIAMGTEERVSIKLDENITYRGLVDRLDVDQKQMSVIDYKTSRKFPTDQNDTSKDQITLYALGIQQRYESKIDTLIGKVIYLHLQQEVTREISQEDLDRVQEKYFKLATQILHNKKLREAGDKESFPPIEGPHCSSCPFQQICPVFVHGYKHDEAVNFEDMQVDSLKGFIDEYARISAQMNELKKQKDYMGKLLGEYAVNHDYKKLYGNDHKLSVQTYTSYKPLKESLDTLKEKLAEDGVLDEVLDIPYYTLSKQFTSGNLDYENYQDIVEKSVSHSASRPSKLKEKDRELFQEKTGE